MSIQDSIKLVPHGDVVVMEWDMFGEKVNKLSTPMMMRLKELLLQVKSSQYKALVMISRKPTIFIAGADIDEIASMKKKEDFLTAVQGGHEIFNLLEDLPQVTIAAVHGACMGGGCEMILSCDYRLASDDRSTKIGLPETQLGIIPGFGGCVRLPRVIGLEASLDIILNGKAVDSRKAEKLGLVDKVTHVNLLEGAALAWAKEKIAAGAKKRRKKFVARGLKDKIIESFPGQRLAVSQARKGVAAKAGNHYPALPVAIDVISKTYGMSDRTRALELEAKGFCEVAGGEVSKNLIGIFYMREQALKKSGVPGDVKPLPVKSLGVLGAGTMGGGIAYVAADKGIEVRMKDVKDEFLAKGFQAARDIWEKARKKKRLDSYEMQQKMNRISGGLDFAGFGQLDVVIEAIVEDMGIKQKVIAETAKHCKPDCIIATNTSSLSVNEMAKGHPHPENFVGMHFFNPVNMMPLVEVIRGEKSSDVAVATIFELTKKIGKIPVVTKDGPGFIVNRLLMPYLIEAMFILQDGMSIETVDRLYKKEFGMPMGPFALMDEVGIDVCVKVAKIFHQSLGDRIQLPDAMLKMKDWKNLGKKTGRGFYIYGDGKPQVDQSVYASLGLKSPSDPLPKEQVINRGVYAMINEAALALIEERIVDSASEVDLAMIMGTGFPPFRGGLLKYADNVGTAKIADDLEIYATKFGHRFKPTVPLRNLAKNGKGFY